MPYPSLQNRPPRSSSKTRARVGIDNVLFFEEFQGSAQNTGQFAFNASTMTFAQSGGYAILNNGADTTNGTHARLSTYLHLPVYGGFPTQFDFRFKLAQVPQANNVVEIGAGFCSAASAPTDGIFLRLTGASTYQLVINNNGTERTFTLPQEVTFAASRVYHVVFEVNEQFVDLYIDGRLVVSTEAARTDGVPTSAAYWPMQARTYNTGVVAAAQKLSISHVSAMALDQSQIKLWPDVMARAGWSGYQGQTAQTMGQTANYANSTVPASASLSNTAAGYTTLGGQWQFATVAGAETDYALFAYQNPAGTASVPGKTLHVKRIRIACWNTGAAVATTATLLQWAAAFGATAVSLATAEAANAKAPRRVALGLQSFAIADAIGKQAGDIDVTFDVPLPVHPGEFFHLILRMPIGTATASQVIRGVALIEAYND